MTFFDDKIDFISDDLDKVDIKQKRHENEKTGEINIDRIF